MPPGVKAACLIVGTIVLASPGYAAWMVSQGRGDQALPLLISSVVCGAFIAVLANRGSAPKG